MKKPPNPALPIPQKGELIGYARVSTADQVMDLQLDALRKAGCLNIHEEPATSGAKKNRPVLDMAIKDLRPGDTLVVWRLDRLSRSIKDLYERLGQIERAGAGFKSLTEAFDFTTATGRLILGMLAIMAEFERQLTIERTKAGMAVLREKGHKMGAPAKLTKALRKKAKDMLAQKVRKEVGGRWVKDKRKPGKRKWKRGKIVWRKRYTKEQIAKAVKVSTGTIYNLLKET
jgi:DNA invertase Pin-like site-specific DNA recombinase